MAADVAVGFVDATSSLGVQYSHGFSDPKFDLHLAVSGGVASGDFDGDGSIDLYTVGGDAGANHLLRNRGDGSFVDVAVAAGVDLPHTNGCGPVFADYDGDGRLDLFVGIAKVARPEPMMQGRAGTLFRNLGDGTFADVTSHANLGTELGPYNSAAFGDYDRDGDLDMLATHWGMLLDNLDTPDGDRRQLSHLWRNNGDGTFTPDPTGAGIDVRVADFGFLHWYWSFTPNFADINNDGWPDVLLASDFKNSQVFLNTGAGTYRETTMSVISDENGMGAAIGDYDNDGDLDWFVSSIYDPENPEAGTSDWGGSGNRFYRNRGDGTFEDVTDMAGVRDGAWGWGSCFADFNNDGFLDLFHVNGWGVEVGRSKFFEKPARLFMSNGDGSFSERAAQSGIDDHGEGRGIVCFDYDNDGDVDVFIANNGQPPRLYRNETGNQKSFLQVKLHGRAPNTEAIGARVYVNAGSRMQMRELRAGSNYVSQDPVVAHFGLGDAALVDELRVVWPDQSSETRYLVPANSVVVIAQGEAPPVTLTPTSTPSVEVTFSVTMTATPSPTEVTPPPTMAPTAPTTTPTASPTLTPSPRVSASGDANCDGAVTAADLSALVVGIVSGNPAQCTGADANLDGGIDNRDIEALTAALFTHLP